ncbi:MAG: hypothetical protein V1797_09625 [Pseudomonadota bacterium]
MGVSVLAENFRIMFRNHADQAALACPGAAENFPALMLQDLDRSKLCRGADPDTLVIQGQWERPRTCGALILLQHNLTTNGSIRLTTDRGHDWTWGAWESIYRFGRAPLGKGVVGGYPGRTDIEELTAGPARFIYFGPEYFTSWTLTLSDPGNPDGWLECGRLFLGPYLQAQVNFIWPYRLGHVDYSQQQRLPGGKLQVRKQRSANRLEVEFASLPHEAHFGEFHQWVRAVGNHTPFFVDPVPTAGGAERFWHRMYCHRVDTNLPETTFANRGHYSLSLEEAL